MALFGVAVVVVIVFSARFIFIYKFGSISSFLSLLLLYNRCGVHLFVYLFKFFCVFNFPPLSLHGCASVSLHFFCLICNAYLVIHGVYGMHSW